MLEDAEVARNGGAVVDVASPTPPSTPSSVSTCLGHFGLEDVIVDFASRWRVREVVEVLRCPSLPANEGVQVNVKLLAAAEEVDFIT